MRDRHDSAASSIDTLPEDMACEAVWITSHSLIPLVNVALQKRVSYYPLCSSARQCPRKGTLLWVLMIERRASGIRTRGGAGCKALLLQHV
jgi:hypothetical protein